MPFVLTSPRNGRSIITSANAEAQSQGITLGMAVADARAIVPSLQVADDQPDHTEKLLKKLGEWCIRFTPVVSIDSPEGLILDVSGCAHLWGGEEEYLNAILQRLCELGFDARAAIAQTIGAAWAVSRYGQEASVVPFGQHMEAIQHLPPQALRIDTILVEQFIKLGLLEIGQFRLMPRKALRRRFGEIILLRLDQAMGVVEEKLDPLIPIEPFEDRLPCLEPIISRPGIQGALRQLLDRLCDRMNNEQMGLREAVFSCYRVDGKILKLNVGTSRCTHNSDHLFSLFELKLDTIDPGFGIELFSLTARRVEKVLAHQITWWGTEGMNDERIAQLVDRFTCKLEGCRVRRYLPAEHYWPERSYKEASWQEQAITEWKTHRRRPLHLLKIPEVIQVTAPIPDYPPMLFRHRGQLHKVVKADGPERIEQEWWLQQGQHRDYYTVEDEEGRRYWIFRSGHYDDEKYQWFIHGFFE